MEKQTAERLVHYYETAHRRILCGSPAGEDHSTKHARGVTCSRCLGLLQERAAEGAGTRGGATASGGIGV